MDEHFDTPAAIYRAHKPLAFLGQYPGLAPHYTLTCVLCKITWPCDASRMADQILRPDGDPR